MNDVPPEKMLDEATSVRVAVHDICGKVPTNGFVENLRVLGNNALLKMLRFQDGSPRVLLPSFFREPLSKELKPRVKPQVVAKSTEHLWHVPLILNRTFHVASRPSSESKDVANLLQASISQLLPMRLVPLPLLHICHSEKKRRSALLFT